MDEQTITEAFRKLYRTRQELWQASEKTIAARIELEKERAARLLSGEIIGKNEAERDARARELLTRLFIDVEAAETAERQSRIAYELAKIEVERIDFLLRLMMATASKSADEPRPLANPTRETTIARGS